MDIYIINIASAEKVSEDILSEFQKKKFMDEAKRKQHCFSYLMLDRILKNVYEVKNTEIEFVDTKPFLKTREKYFSISHSNKYVVVAVSDFNCGVDAEEIRERDYKNISKRMKFNSDSLYEFYKDWTMYEAKYKMGKQAQSSYIMDFDNYMLTAVSESSEESFEVYIQNGT